MSEIRSALAAANALHPVPSTPIDSKKQLCTVSTVTDRCLFVGTSKMNCIREPGALAAAIALHLPHQLPVA